MVRVTRFLLISAVAIVFFLSSCIQTQPITCRSPYILVGLSCCLDANNNSICDADENKKEGIICSKPYIRVGAGCCLDRNNDKICDSEELWKTAAPSTERKYNYTIDNVQANINKALLKDSDKVIFRKVNITPDDYEFHTDGKKTTTLLLRKGTKEFFSVSEKSDINIVSIKNGSNYIKNKGQFIDLVKNQAPVLTSYLQTKKNLTLHEIKDGQIRDYIKGKSEFSFYLVNYTFNSTPIYDNLTGMDYLSDRIAEILKLSLENYETWYNSSNDRLVNAEFNGVEYLQAYSIQCSPSLVITIYAKGYKEPKGYQGSFNEDGFRSLVINERKRLLSEAQAIIEICDKL